MTSAIAVLSAARAWASAAANAAGVVLGLTPNRASASSCCASTICARSPACAAFTSVAAVSLLSGLRPVNQPAVGASRSW